MLKKFLSNCKKPTRKFGKMIVSAMNKGHAPLALWAFEVCPLKDGESVLDVGCGGGGNLVRILERCPKSRGRRRLFGGKRCMQPQSNKKICGQVQYFVRRRHEAAVSGGDL